MTRLIAIRVGADLDLGRMRQASAEFAIGERAGRHMMVSFGQPGSLRAPEKSLDSRWVARPRASRVLNSYR